MHTGSVSNWSVFCLIPRDRPISVMNSLYSVLWQFWVSTISMNAGQILSPIIHTYKFSRLRSPYIFLKNKLREFDTWSKHFPCGDRFINSPNLFSWWWICIVKRKLMWVALVTERLGLLLSRTGSNIKHCQDDPISFSKILKTSFSLKLLTLTVVFKGLTYLSNTFYFKIYNISFHCCCCCFLGGLFGALFNAINHHLSIFRMK